MRLSSKTCFFTYENIFYSRDILENKAKEFYENSKLYAQENDIKEFKNVYGSDLWNRFIYEIKPLIRFVINNTKVDAISFTGSSKNHFDATLKFNNGKLQNIEVTTSIDGEKENLKDEILQKHKFILDAPRIDKEKLKDIYGIRGTKNKRTIENYNQEKDNFENGLIDISKYCEEDCRSIHKKIKKNIDDRYNSLWLLIYANHKLDNLHKENFINKEYISTLKKEVKKIEKNPFSKIFIYNEDGITIIEEIFSATNYW